MGSLQVKNIKTGGRRGAGEISASLVLCIFSRFKPFAIELEDTLIDVSFALEVE